jgi:membrane protein implicated in regulation of membrane protease activity
MWDFIRNWIFGWVSEISAIVWLILAFISAVVEVSVPHFGFAFVGAGAVVAAAVAYFGGGIVYQLAAFVVVMTGSLLLLRSRLLSKIGGRGVPERTAQLIGRQGVVTHAIDSVVGAGRVNVGGEDWAARSAAVIPEGTAVRVTAADGIVLEVTPL